MKKSKSYGALMVFMTVFSVTTVSAMETYASNYMSWQGWGIIGKRSDASFSTNSDREVTVVNTISRDDNPYAINAFSYTISDATYYMQFNSHTSNGTQNGLDILGYI